MDNGGFRQIIYIGDMQHKNKTYQRIYFDDEQDVSGDFQGHYVIIVVLLIFAVAIVLKWIKRHKAP